MRNAETLSPPLAALPALAPAPATRAPARVSEATLARVQAWSGLTFGAFLALHLFNVLLAVLGPAAHDRVQGALRGAYQAPPVELVVVALALVLHVGAGVWRARRRARATTDARTRLHRRLGWALAVIVVGHVAATRGPSLLLGIWPGFAGVSFTLHWLPEVFYPYYFAFGLMGAAHLGIGVARSVRLLTRRALPGSRRAGVIGLALFAAALLLALLAYGGRLFPVPDPMTGEYARLYTE